MQAKSLNSSWMDIGSLLEEKFIIPFDGADESAMVDTNLFSKKIFLPYWQLSKRLHNPLRVSGEARLISSKRTQSPVCIAFSNTPWTPYHTGEHKRPAAGQPRNPLRQRKKKESFPPLVSGFGKTSVFGLKSVTNLPTPLHLSPPHGDSCVPPVSEDPPIDTRWSKSMYKHKQRSEGEKENPFHLRIPERE